MKDNQKHYSNALVKFQEALKIQLEINDIPGTASSYLSIGETYYRLKDYNSSETYFLKGYELAKQLNEWELLRQSNAGLYTLYSKIKDFKKSLRLF